MEEIAQIEYSEFLIDTKRFSDAETHLLRGKALFDQYRFPRISEQDVFGNFIRLYESWHRAEPNQGYDQKAAEWRAKYAAQQSTTQPTSSQPAVDSIKGLIDARKYDEAERAVFHILEPQLALSARDPKYNPQVVAQLRLTLSRIYQRRDEPRLALTQLKEVYLLKPNEAGINNQLGYLYAEMGIELGKAESMIRRALSETPNDPNYLDSLGWVLYKKNRIDDAIAILGQALSIQSKRPSAVIFDHLGDAQYRAGRQQDARKSWERALGIGSGSSRASVSTSTDPKDCRFVQQLWNKLKQLEGNENVQVAPLGDVAGVVRPSAPNATSAP
jgi:Tfp pilus assembly protein PilF